MTMHCLFPKTMAMVAITLLMLGAPAKSMPTVTESDIQTALSVMNEVANKRFATVCGLHIYQRVYIPLETSRYDNIRQKADMGAWVIQQVGLVNQSDLIDATCKSLIIGDRKVITARFMILNGTTGNVIHAVTWKRPKGLHSSSRLEILEPRRAFDENPVSGMRPDRVFPWYEDAAGSPLWSPKFMSSPPSASYKGWWTYPYYSCTSQRWLISYSVPLPFAGRHMEKGFLSLDVDISNLEVNQCEFDEKNRMEDNKEISIFYGTHKCHNTTVCRNRPNTGLVRGGYDCVCKPGFYRGNGVFNGTEVEIAWEGREVNGTNTYDMDFVCFNCTTGCNCCVDDLTCLNHRTWNLRTALFDVFVGFGLLLTGLITYLFRHKLKKMIKISNPAYLAFSLGGGSILLAELVAIYPMVGLYTCVLTKWARHVGFSFTCTAILVKTWGIFSTPRDNRSADRHGLHWTFPIPIILVAYFGICNLGSTPVNDDLIKDLPRLQFKQCSSSWWDHLLTIAEVLCLAWCVQMWHGVRITKIFSEARLIFYVIYYVAVVHFSMSGFHSIVFPEPGQDMKYFLDFLRTQLSTMITIMVVFWPKAKRWRNRNNYETAIIHNIETTNSYMQPESNFYYLVWNTTSNNRTIFHVSPESVINEPGPSNDDIILELDPEHEENIELETEQEFRRDQ